jgi:hypothetical protein
MLDGLAAHAFVQKRWPDAARWSNMSLKQGSDHPEDMNRILQDSRRKLTPEENGKFLEEDSTFDARMVTLKREAAAAEREGTAAMTPGFKKFLETFEGVQREGGAPLGLSGGGSAAADVDNFTDDEVNRLFLNAQVNIAREQLRSGQIDKAKETLTDVVKAGPKSPQAKEAQKLLDLIKESGR